VATKRQLSAGKLAWALGVGALSLCSCGKPPSASSPPVAVVRTPIFDQIAAEPKYSNAIAQADQDLPGDRWEKKPFNINHSRWERVAPIGREILLEVKPKLKEMTVAELMHCLKVQDGSGFVTCYMGDALYPEGNNMIIVEIKSRAAAEREVLRTWPRDKYGFLDTGIQGPPVDVDEVARDLAPSPEDLQKAKSPDDT